MLTNLFFALDLRGRLIATGFDHEELILLCWEKRFEIIVIFYIRGAILIFERIDVADRLKLPAEHKFKSFWWPRRWRHEHKIRSIPRQFEKDKFFKFCWLCGKIIE